LKDIWSTHNVIKRLVWLAIYLIMQLAKCS